MALPVWGGKLFCCKFFQSPPPRFFVIPPPPPVFWFIRGGKKKQTPVGPGEFLGDPGKDAEHFFVSRPPKLFSPDGGPSRGPFFFSPGGCLGCPGGPFGAEEPFPPVFYLLGARGKNRGGGGIGGGGEKRVFFFFFSRGWDGGEESLTNGAPPGFFCTRKRLGRVLALRPQRVFFRGGRFFSCFFFVSVSGSV